MAVSDSMHPPLHQKVLLAIQEYQLCNKNDCLIVGVSGGADSVALLDLLSSLPSYSLRLVVAHLNHLLRAAESDADEQFVRDLAGSYGAHFEAIRVDVLGLAKARRVSLEEAGREARYAFFEELRIRHNASAISVAHHQNDQAETFLIRLLRGAGTAGLSAMSSRAENRIVRPLLGITSTELREHLKERNLSFREDSSNKDLAFLRNRIRHDLLPTLSRYNPAISERLAATARLLAEDEQLLSEITDRKWSALSLNGYAWAAVPRLELAKEPAAMRLRLYRQAILHASGDLRKIELKHCQSIEKLLNSGQTGSSISLPKNLSAVLTKDHLLLAMKELLRPAEPQTQRIESVGSYQLGNGLSLKLEYVTKPEQINKTPDFVTYIDLDNAPLPWIIRPLKRGDKLQPIGMTGNCLVSSIFSDAGFPRHLRTAIPLLMCNSDPLWLVGIKRTSTATVSFQSRNIIKISLEGRELLPLFP